MNIFIFKQSYRMLFGETGHFRFCEDGYDVDDEAANDANANGGGYNSSSLQHLLLTNPGEDQDETEVTDHEGKKVLSIVFVKTLRRMCDMFCHTHMTYHLEL